MISDGEGKGAVLGDPVAGGDPGIHKEEDLIRDAVAVKADLSGDDRGSRGGLIDRSNGDGGELRATLAVEDHAIDAVRILSVRHAVENHVAHRDLTVQALSTRFGGNDSGEPIEIVRVIVGRAALQRFARGAKLYGSCGMIPRKIHTKCLGKRANGNEKAVPDIQYPLRGIKISARGNQIISSVGDGQGHVALFDGCRCGLCVPSDRIRARKLREASQGDVCNRSYDDGFLFEDLFSVKGDSHRCRALGEVVSDSCRRGACHHKTCAEDKSDEKYAQTRDGLFDCCFCQTFYLLFLFFRGQRSGLLPSMFPLYRRPSQKARHK